MEEVHVWAELQLQPACLLPFLSPPSRARPKSDAELFHQKEKIGRRETKRGRTVNRAIWATAHGPPPPLPAWEAKTKRKKSIFPPPTLTQVRFSSLNFKIGQTTSLDFSNHAFYLPRAVLKAVLLQ
jgi:hypothetical protein